MIVEVEIDNPQPAKNSDITVNKTGTESQDGTMTYTITVTSQNGTDNVVKLTDVMKNLEGFDGNITITNPQGGTETKKVTKSDGGFAIELPKLNPKDTYTITYKAKLPKDALTNGIATNTVHVESTKTDGGKIEDSSKVETSYKQTQYVSKEGKKDGDKIKWTVTVNAGKHDISNWTLKDVFNDAYFTGPVTMTDSQGTSKTVTLPYTFPKGSKDTYTITYETTADKPLGQAALKNRAELTKPDGSSADSGEIQVNPDPNGQWVTFNPLSKKAESLTVNGDNTATIQWRVTIHAKDGSIPAPWYYQDTLQGDQYFTNEQYEALTEAVAIAIRDKKLQGSIVPNKNSKNQITGYRIDFGAQLNKGESFTFTYSSTAPIQNEKAEQTFKNKGTVNDKVESYGSIDYKPLVRKYDTNKPDGSDTSHSYYDKVMDENGTLKWGIAVALPKGYKGGDLTVTEKLPEGVDLQKLTMKPEGVSSDGNLTAGEYTFSWWSGSETVKYRVTAARSGQNVTITIPEALAGHKNLSRITFAIEAKIRDDFEWPMVDGKPAASFRNEVEVTSKDGSTHGTEGQTQTITKYDDKPKITKTNGTVADSIIPYSITINPKGEDLVEGSDTLTLVDTVKVDTAYTAKNTILSLIPGSVQVFRLNSDGTKGERIDSARVPYELEITEEGTQWNPFTHYTMTMKIPDQTPLVVEYKYKANSPDIGASKQIENTAKLEGVGATSEEVKNSISVKIEQSSAGAQTDGLTIIKVDSANYSITLPGAQFKLYKYNAKTEKYEVIKDGTGKEQVFLTDNFGRFMLQNLTYNTAYYLEEVSPPDGYLKPEHPYYFYLVNTDTVTYPVAKPAGFDGKEQQGGSVVYVPNETSTTQIEVVKKWFNKAGTETTASKGGSINFELYRKESTVKPGGGATGGKVKIRWRGLKYGGAWFDLPNAEYPIDVAGAEGDEIPIGTIVKVTLTAGGESGGNRVDDSSVSQYLKLKVNGAEVPMLREPGTSNFSYSFSIQVDTTLVLELSGGSGTWMFQNGPYSWSFQAPQTTGPAPETVKKVGDFTVESTKDWKWVSEKLPKTGMKDGKTVYYTYYVKESSVTNCETTYENNEGVVSGTITIKNKMVVEPTHELPATGGIGTRMYTIGGLLTIYLSLLLLYRNKKQRKEDYASF